MVVGKIRNSIIAAVIILALVSFFYLLGTLITLVLGLPPHLRLPAAFEAVGTLLVVLGGLLIIWLFRYRHPATMLVSTYFTFRKLFTRTPVEKMSGRVEPLVIQGPQRFVRHPLYLGAVLIFLGWGLLGGSTADLLILLWFVLAQIPFEEKEMRLLFGDPYLKYRDDTPMLIPFTRLKRH